MKIRIITDFFRRKQSRLSETLVNISLKDPIRSKNAIDQKRALKCINGIMALDRRYIYFYKSKKWRYSHLYCYAKRYLVA
jgi:hypothetical protein